MFGPFRPTSSLCGGLLWKRPWRLSPPQKARQRARLRHVDRVVATLDTALTRQAQQQQAAAAAPASTSAQSSKGAQAKSKAAKAEGKGEEAAPGIVRTIEKWKAEMPTEGEMLPRDKYTMFDRKERKYRKGIHKLPKWTRVSQRLNPPGF